MKDDLSDARALDVAAVLALLVPGADVEIAPSQHAMLERLVAAGLVARATDLERARRELAEKKAALAAITTTDAARVAEARREILALSESLASADGAAFVRLVGSDGPYRGTTSVRAGYVLTQAGRALLSNLGPRAARAPELALPDFATQLRSLEDLFAMRVQRAADLVARVQPRMLSLPPHALRSAMLGLASMPHPTDALGDAFFVLYAALRQTFVGTPFAPEQDAAIAETMLLHYANLAVAYEASVPAVLVRWRDELLALYCTGRPEDALDAMLLLAAVPLADREPRMVRAAAFATEMGRRGTPTPLSLALLATAGGDGAAHVEGIALAYQAIHILTSDPLEALTVAVLAAIQSTRTVESQLARIRTLHGYLARIAPSGMLTAAALLALLDGEEGGVLDDLRLASKAVQERRLVPGGAEATSLGLKLLLHSALLARGNEGDPEESSALALRALPAVAAFDLVSQGLGTMSATLPLLTGSVVAFHRPMLNAAVIYEEHSRPMHSDYVFGGGGWSGSSGSHHAHHSHHRSFGWG